MDALVKAAQKEGTLNVIALPPDWANYGDDHQGVREEVRHQGQSATSPTPRARTRSTPPTSSRAPTALPTCSTSASPSPWPTPTCSRRTRWRRGTTSRPSSRTPTAPGSTTTAATCRSATTPAKVPDVTTIDDLLGPDFKGKVALNGDPTAGRRRVQRRGDGLDRATAAPPTTSHPASTSSRRSRMPATSCRSTRPRRPSSPARPRWSSTGTT